MKQWSRVEACLKNPYLTPDNNVAENAIHPFATDRKNWLFSGYPRGAKSSATIYSLIETAKANGLNPYEY
ncbi:transposase [Desulfovibrio sp. UCD-KL4C]|uniref:IS66 family transposase n=1 Tax=Desulfovibrio sp. UCD-KL4C TaxID=2578120 RepID=UPI0025C102B2|nr:transposase [Desulfovibrio sp. UCD-KL4C]